MIKGQTTTRADIVNVVLAVPGELLRVAEGHAIVTFDTEGRAVELRIPTLEEWKEASARAGEYLDSVGALYPPQPSDEWLKEHLLKPYRVATALY
jgi:hypothetical protein